MSDVGLISSLRLKDVAETRAENLSERVLATARAVAARGDGRIFTVESIRPELPGINSQRLTDAVRTLKDNGRILAFGKGAYELAESFPAARQISVSILQDGFRLLEVGDEVSVALTPEECRLIGGLFAADTVQAMASEQLRLLRGQVQEISMVQRAALTRMAAEGREGQS